MPVDREINELTDVPSFLIGGGEMGTMMRGFDWTGCALSGPTTWPQSLRAAVSIMLNSRYPIALYWGPELALLYNDAWSAIPGEKHPWAMGRPGREVWPEIWDAIAPLFDRVLATGEGVWQEDELLPMHRHGYLEECYYNFTFSPVRGEDGRIDGIFNAVVETTDRVLSERRLRTLSRMGERANASLSVDDACSWAVAILAENAADVPFALVYLREEAGLRCVAQLGIKAGAPAFISHDAIDQAPWPLAEAVVQRHAVIGPAAPDAAPLSRYWQEPVTEIATVPISVAGDEAPAAFLVAGANPRRRVDATYRSFFELAAGHIGTVLTTARAYEDERQRALGAGRDRSRQDGVLLERQPRIPHAADADAGPARGCAVAGSARTIPSASRSNSRTATRCVCCASSTRCSISRASRPGASRRAFGRSIWLR